MWRTKVIGIAAAVAALGATANRSASAAPPAAGKATLDKAEATAAFESLNNVRADPPAFGKEIGVDLSKIGPRPKLRWDANLAKAAEAKALDMAQRDFFGHVDPDGFGMNVRMDRAGYRLPSAWLKPPSSNFFESIDGGADGGKDAIKVLIVDKGVPDLGHRNHLLGLTPFWADCKDAGVGFARNPKAKFRTYVSILIAKHGP